MSTLDQSPSDLVTEAVGWPDTITITYDINHTITYSPTRTQVTKGSATWTLNRATLAGNVKCPKLAFQSTDLTPLLDKGEFLPVQCAYGKMPGWVVFFGPQPDPVKGAQTVTNTDTSLPPGQQTTTDTQDLSCPSLSATCVQQAPNRWFREYVFAINGVGQGYQDPNAPSGIHDDESYQVELLQSGISATASAPAVLPVYRVTLPLKAYYISKLSFSANGTQYGGDAGFESGEGEVGTFGSVGTVYLRSLTTYDVEMFNVGDVLSAGTVSYSEAENRDSVLMTDGYMIRISNPFPMEGQSFSSADALAQTPPDDSGVTITVQF